MLGLIIRATKPNDSKWVDRANEQPVFYVGTVPVFEIWFWDAVSRLWFVMSPKQPSYAAVWFHPLHTKDQITQLRDAWRAYRAAGGGEPNSAART